jgi:hypothetical protein
MEVAMSEQYIREQFLKLKLDIRAVSMLCQSEQLFRTLVRNELFLSSDNDIQRFLSVIRGSEAKPSSMITVAGNLIVASVLLFFGLLFIAPLLAGLNQSYVSNFLYNVMGYILNGNVSRPLLIVEDAALSFTLIISSLYLIRYSSRILKIRE